MAIADVDGDGLIDYNEVSSAPLLLAACLLLLVRVLVARRAPRPSFRTGRHALPHTATAQFTGTLFHSVHATPMRAQFVAATMHLSKLEKEELLQKVPAAWRPCESLPCVHREGVSGRRLPQTSLSQPPLIRLGLSLGRAPSVPSQAFKQLDRDGSGTISLDELSDALRRFGIYDDAKELLASADTNQVGWTGLGWAGLDWTGLCCDVLCSAVLCVLGGPSTDHGAPVHRLEGRSGLGWPVVRVHSREDCPRALRSDWDPPLNLDATRWRIPLHPLALGRYD
jgi:hypothetical protein